MDADERKTRIEEDIDDLVADVRRGQPRRVDVVVADEANVVDVMDYLTDEGIVHLSTITGRDDGNEIELLYHMFEYGEEEGEGDLGEGIVLTVRVHVPKGSPRIESITDVVPGAAMYEREITDILGVEFEGHPNPETLLLPDDWEEDERPPLLKDEPEEAEVDD
jgi:NADH-quinone oxidoreductase subunit C